ncbi:hypothetical protein D3C72_1759980 [compost metagenome]
MLAVERFELARRLRRLAGIEVGEALIVEHFRRIGFGRQLGDVDIGIVLAGGNQGAAGNGRDNDGGDAR